MITFNNLSKNPPYKRFKKEYDKAVLKNQNIVEAICISSILKDSSQVDSRFVNLKIVENEEFIFFSNYNSPKSEQFASHNQISAAIFWSETNIQIRMKAKIKRLSKKENDSYFKTRKKSKNALAISSNQSKKANSYEDIKSKYIDVLDKDDLTVCPDYWGGFSFKPYYFEFWKGDPNRLNKRDVFSKDKEVWNEFILQP